jgi:hypothetical protein
MTDDIKKVDFKRELKHLYRASSKKIEIAEVSSMNFLMIDGKGDPNNSPTYSAAVAALYGLSYALKFAIKKAQSIDYKVMPLEGLWWVEDMTKFSTDHKDDWSWTMMIMQPEYITPQLVEEHRAIVSKKKQLPSLPSVRLDAYDEGLSIQLMHIGAYADEAPNIARMHKFIEDNGYAINGKHHEIYLSDPRRAAPEKMKTILRQPIKK